MFDEWRHLKKKVFFCEFWVWKKVFFSPLLMWTGTHRSEKMMWKVFTNSSNLNTTEKLKISVQKKAKWEWKTEKLRVKLPEKSFMCERGELKQKNCSWWVKKKVCWEFLVQTRCCGSSEEKCSSGNSSNNS